MYLVHADTGVRTALWDAPAVNSQRWQRASVHLYSDDPFYVEIEGVRGSTFLSDVAVDDISFSESCQGK